MKWFQSKLSKVNQNGKVIGKQAGSEQSAISRAKKLKEDRY
jgi:hypothetical protein